MDAELANVASSSASVGSTDDTGVEETNAALAQSSVGLLMPQQDPIIGRPSLVASVPAEAELGSILAARLSPSGGAIAILDGVSPFVKLFSSTGKFLGSLAQVGAVFVEPPSAIALNDSELLLFTKTGSGVLFDMENFSIRSMFELPIYPLAAHWFCNRWLVHGPGRNTKEHNTRAWLWSVDLHSEARTTPLFFDADSILPLFSVHAGIVSHGETAVVRHTLSEPRRLLTLRCSRDGQIALVDDSAEMKISSTLENETYPVGVARFTPVGHNKQVVLLVDGFLSKGRMFTRFQYDVDSVSSSKVFDNLTWLADGNEKVGFLLAQNFPLPQIHLLGSSEFLSWVAPVSPP